MPPRLLEPLTHADGAARCPWPGTDPLYVAYHDEEWGVPEWDDRALFEKLMLDGFQAGLSWITILRKREAFRAAFDGFDPEKIARYGERDFAQPDGRCRHRAQPREDRSRAGAGAGLSRPAGQGRLRPPSLGFRRRAGRSRIRAARWPTCPRVAPKPRRCRRT